MGVFAWFSKRISAQISRWKELGTYKSQFYEFSGELWKSEIIRSCVRPLCEFSAKATASCGDKNLERLLNNRPNIFMTGHDFIYKVRAQLELKNTAFILISRKGAKPEEFYPIPYSTYEYFEYGDGIFVRFHFSGRTQTMDVPLENLAILRKDYIDGDISGESNDAIRNTLNLINTTNQGLSNAVKATANLRGILKSTKTMLAPDDVKKQKDQFVKDYLSLENEGGIASLDGTQEFTPIKMEPVVATYDQMREYRENVYRYFGVNDKVVMSNMTADEMETFYELRIMPFLIALGQELTSKVYSQRELTFPNNYIAYSESKLQFATLAKKVDLFSRVVLYGGMTVNEWRRACNMDPIEGGDVRIMRLDAGSVTADGDAIAEEDKEESDNA